MCGKVQNLPLIYVFTSVNVVLMRPSRNKHLYVENSNSSIFPSCYRCAGVLVCYNRTALVFRVGNGIFSTIECGKLRFFNDINELMICYINACIGILKLFNWYCTLFKTLNIVVRVVNSLLNGTDSVKQYVQVIVTLYRKSITIF